MDRTIYLLVIALVILSCVPVAFANVETELLIRSTIKQEFKRVEETIQKNMYEEIEKTRATVQEDFEVQRADFNRMAIKGYMLNVLTIIFGMILGSFVMYILERRRKKINDVKVIINTPSTPEPSLVPTAPTMERI